MDFQYDQYANKGLLLIKKEKANLAQLALPPYIYADKGYVAYFTNQ